MTFRIFRGMFSLFSHLATWIDVFGRVGCCPASKGSFVVLVLFLHSLLKSVYNLTILKMIFKKSAYTVTYDSL